MNATTPTANKAAIPLTISAVRRDVEATLTRSGRPLAFVPSRNGAGMLVASCVSSVGPVKPTPP